MFDFQAQKEPRRSDCAQVNLFTACMTKKCVLPFLRTVLSHLDTDRMCQVLPKTSLGTVG